MGDTGGMPLQLNMRSIHSLETCNSREKSLEHVENGGEGIRQG